MDNREIGDRIKHRRQELRLTQGDIAAAIGVAVSTVQRYEAGTIDKPKLPVLDAIARMLQVDPAWLCGNAPSVPPVSREIPYRPTHRIPILGRISAGLPLYADEHIEGYTYTDLNGGAEYFALRVTGDSMNAVRINDGDLLIVRRQDIVDNGDIAVVLVDDEDATVKRFYREGNTITLMPQSTNPVHQPQIYDSKKTRIRIQGRVVRNEIAY